MSQQQMGLLLRALQHLRLLLQPHLPGLVLLLLLLVP
jgi:hypothetical protein